MKPVLEIHQLSKRYRIGGKKERYLSLRERLSKTFFTGAASTTNFFLALDQVSFEVAEGDCIGIIGKNGAGKSTLLKILSKITPPTSGYIKARGRVASLLEVGTGFHPELTGRENVYLNGSILGLKKQEIDQKFDEIVSFSGVEMFLDTSLKHYSSGMQLRLAFAVAAHLEPEILLIDEVLAVGDAEFQKKCIGKMDEVSKSGRTILFVSHNLEAMQKLCPKGILLQNGRLVADGNINDLITTYLATNLSHEKFYDSSSMIRYLKIAQVEDKIQLIADYETTIPFAIPSLGFVIYNQMGHPVVGYNPLMESNSRMDYQYPSKGRVIATMTQPKLLDGTYNVSVWFGSGQVDFFEDQNCLQLAVQAMTSLQQMDTKLVGHAAPTCHCEFLTR